MQQTSFQDETFEKADFTAACTFGEEYENCRFLHCDFSGADISNITFAECEFISCNLSTVKTAGTSLRDARFKDCKLMGIHFHTCNDFLFSVEFENCLLNMSSFFKLPMKKTSFTGCSLREVDFSETDLSEAKFDQCDFLGAFFDHTRLEKADFRTAFNYMIDPENNRIKGAKFSAAGISGLLSRYQIDIE